MLTTYYIIKSQFIDISANYEKIRKSMRLKGGLCPPKLMNFGRNSEDCRISYMLGLVFDQNQVWKKNVIGYLFPKNYKIFSQKRGKWGSKVVRSFSENSYILASRGLPNHNQEIYGEEMLTLNATWLRKHPLYSVYYILVA